MIWWASTPTIYFGQFVGWVYSPTMQFEHELVGGHTHPIGFAVR
jgi:hypothetical protein